MYIIVGGSGFLGLYMVKNILEKTQDEIVATYFPEKPSYKHERLVWFECNVKEQKYIDLLNEKYADRNPKIIYLAAYPSPDFCEKDPVEAWNLNVTALANFVNQVKNPKCLYFASTDVTYGEGKFGEKFKENSPYNPSNSYGRHKVLGEQLVLAKGFNVFRLPLMMNKSLVDGKKHFFDIICETLSSGKEIEMFKDSYRSILSFNQCAGFVIDLIEKYGSCEEKIINLASDEPISKVDLAEQICDMYGYDKNLIKPISVSEDNQIFSAKRAAYTAMDNTKLKKLLNIDSIKLSFKEEK